MILYAFDPEVKAPAWACYESGRLTGYGKLQRLKDFESYKDGLVSMAERAELCLIEDQYISRLPEKVLRRMNPVRLKKELARVTSIAASAVKLGMVRGEIEMIFRTFKLPVNFIHPASWQQCLRPAVTRAELKKMSVIVARDIAKQFNLNGSIDHNIADAVCMGQWWLKKNLFKSL